MNSSIPKPKCGGNGWTSIADRTGQRYEEAKNDTAERFAMLGYYDFVVGTFSTPTLLTLRFVPQITEQTTLGTLTVHKQHKSIGSHSWLHLSEDKRYLYATAWTTPPSIAAYELLHGDDIKLIGTARTRTRSGYVCASNTHVYSAGGASGEVFMLDKRTGSFLSPRLVNGATSARQSIDVAPLQTLNFVEDHPQRDDGSVMDFGGLRHGAHSVDLSPDGTLLYIADIGRNCIWTYAINTNYDDQHHLRLASKTASPRPHDGPRHVHPHPGGKIVYCVQEHSSIVDVFRVEQSVFDDPGSTKLRHIQAVPIIPVHADCKDFWADEVRTSLSYGQAPRWLYASTRGLTTGQKGYVSVYALDLDGLIVDAPMVETHARAEKPAYAAVRAMCLTTTSGGWANAIQPGPTLNGIEFIAMTDSEVGYVFVLSWDGVAIKEAARVNLNDDTRGTKHGAATAVWL